MRYAIRTYTERGRLEGLVSLQSLQQIKEELRKKKWRKGKKAQR